MWPGGRTLLQVKYAVTEDHTRAVASRCLRRKDLRRALSDCCARCRVPSTPRLVASRLALMGYCAHVSFTICKMYAQCRSRLAGGLSVEAVR